MWELLWGPACVQSSPAGLTPVSNRRLVLNENRNCRMQLSHENTKHNGQWAVRQGSSKSTPSEQTLRVPEALRSGMPGYLLVLKFTQERPVWSAQTVFGSHSHPSS